MGGSWKLLYNEIYRDRLVSLINTECRMLPGLDSERCSECPKQDSEEAQNGTSKKVVLTIWSIELVLQLWLKERKRCVASPMPQS